MKKVILLTCTMLCCAISMQAQTTTDSLRNKRIDRLFKVLSEFRVQAYAQVEWQRADTAGIGSYAGGGFPATSQSRFMVRRGRLKLSYDHKNAKGWRVIEGAFQFDATEKGFTVKDFYGRIVDPFSGWVGFQGGIFLRPFGYESPAAPAYHESPEFSRMNQTIMPNEVELGEAIVVEAPDNFKKKYLDLRFDASLVNGEGIGVGTTAANASANPALTVPVPPISGVNATGAYESKKDFIGRIKLGKVFTLNDETKFAISGSGSYYYGGVLQTTKNVFELKSNSAGSLVYTNVADSGRIAKTYYKREYYGAHLQFDAWYKLGSTMLRAEFIGGTQPGTAKSSAVPEAYGTNLGTSSVPGQDLYVRRFNGLMCYFTQTFKHKIKGHPVAHEITFKYDFYNPNTQVNQKNLSTANDARVSAADVKYQTFGVGYSFKPADYFKLMVWYDVVQNSTSSIKGFSGDLKDNVLTIRTQFMFDSFWFNKK